MQSMSYYFYNNIQVLNIEKKVKLAIDFLARTWYDINV